MGRVYFLVFGFILVGIFIGWFIFYLDIYKVGYRIGEFRWNDRLVKVFLR